MSDVLCFGNLQLDVLCRPVDALPPPGQLRKVDCVDFALSGNGGNIATALGRLGISVDLAGYSGGDVIGESFREMLAAQGVGLRSLLRHPTVGTGTSVIAVAPSGERTVLFVNGSNAYFDLDSVPDAWLDSVKVVSVGSVFVLPQFTQEAVATLFRRAHLRGATTVLNICPVLDRADRLLLAEALAETDYFILNQDEGGQLVGTEQPQQILEELEAQTLGSVILTLGEDGCCFLGTGGVEYVPAERVDAVDSTGAGDSFVAGMIAGLVAGRPLSGAALLGCKVASYAVTGAGAYQRIPSIEEIDRGML